MLSALVAVAAFAPMTMTQLIEEYQADLGSLSRFYNIDASKERTQRMRRFFGDALSKLDKLDFEKLDQGGKVDWILFKNHMNRNLAKLDASERQVAEALPFLPFADEIIALSENRQMMKPVDGKQAAATIMAIETEIGEQRKVLEAKKEHDKFAGFRAARMADRLGELLKEWFDFYNQYDPQFGWWTSEPFEKSAKALKDYSAFLREKVAGIKSGETSPIVGDPIGREALLDELKYEMIPYSPEELIEMGKKEFAWCEAEMKKAAREMGMGDDWKKALEAVKNDYAAPGDQPKVIREMALEAIKYVEDNDLLTVPELAKESWRMNMMSRERQKTSPFFLGGETIMVSFPTAEMEHQEKLMSLRANNIHFARATVHHELIPGHHLQQFMGARNNTQRRAFSTPFWTEGWALYFEFLFWEMGFPKTPQNKIGMLWWRMHRCARIIFSLSFHLKQMSSQECIDMLVDKVGHERSTAEGEVRRSFGGDYSPLYQIAYMVGAFQFWELRRELVDSGKMKNRAFHDRILKESNMPVEMVRALMTNQKLGRDFGTSWRFYSR